MNKTIKTLIVDDEKDILTMLKYNLEKEGYEVVKAIDGTSAIKVLKEEKPDIVLLDIMMPKMDGIETCRKMRELPEGKNSFILLLTARAEEYSEVAGFEAGADDYITKPIKIRALLKRIAAILKRSGTVSEKKNLVFENLQILVDEYMVYNSEEKIVLPKKEFELLYLLMSKPGKVFTRVEILQKVWGSEISVNDRTIDVHIRKLREKLGSDYIQTVKGVGYKFKDSIE